MRGTPYIFLVAAALCFAIPCPAVPVAAPGGAGGPPSGAVCEAGTGPLAQAAAGPKSIVCSLPDQRLYFYEGGCMVNCMRCSTGLGDRTPVGDFVILNHHRTHGVVWGDVCDYWLGFTPSHGIHSWPRNAAEDCESQLGSPVSPGCIVVHPDEAWWPYGWTPDGTRLTVTPNSLAAAVIAGCHAAAGTPSPSPDWYFAEGCTAGGFDTYLLLCNPGEDEVEAAVSFMAEVGGGREHVCRVTPRSRFTLAVDDLPGLASAAFSMQVHASGPVVAERAMYFSRGSQKGGTASAGTPSPSPDWYFAEGCTAGGFDTYLLLCNPGEDEVEAAVSFMTEAGGGREHVCHVAPRSRLTLAVDDLPGLASAAFSMQVHASGPVVAERAMYFVMGHIDGGHACEGVVSPSRDWHFAEGCTGGLFETYLLLGNPGNEDAVVFADFYMPDASVEYGYVVKARSRVTVCVNRQPGLEGKDVAFSVHSARPVVAERAVYCGLDSRRDGHASPGAAAASRDLYFAEGYTDGAFDTYMLLANPGFVDARVEMEYMLEDGSSLPCAFTVPAQRRLTVHVDDLPGLERAAFSARLHSDVPVVAERAVYFAMAR